MPEKEGKRMIFRKKAAVLFLIAPVLILFEPGCAITPHKNRSPAAIPREIIDKTWDQPVYSTVTEWIDYGTDMDTRSRVDFAAGEVEVEAIVPVDTPEAVKTGGKKIADQTRRLFSTVNLLDMQVLRGQVKDDAGRTVTRRNVSGFINKTVLGSLRVRGAPYRAKDGVTRIRLSSRFALVSDHVEVRAEQYSKIVRRHAKRFGLSPSLLMAVIHVESLFNPMAKSGDGAVGLMQVVPESGGRDAYFYLHKSRQIPSETELYRPERNVELGAAYIHRLLTHYFKDIREQTKRTYLALCAYNWGPTAVTNYIVRRYNVADYTVEALLGLLYKKTPPETGAYLKNVVKRIPYYERMLKKIAAKKMDSQKVNRMA
jgi:membrane-bound lytic murein transglycosylase C